MSREAHNQGVGFAGLQVQELENQIMAAKQKLDDEVLGLVVVAVGESPTVTSGRQALELTLGLGEKLTEALGICEEIKGALNTYDGGF